MAPCKCETRWKMVKIGVGVGVGVHVARSNLMMSPFDQGRGWLGMAHGPRTCMEMVGGGIWWLEHLIFLQQPGVGGRSNRSTVNALPGG